VTGRSPSSLRAMLPYVVVTLVFMMAASGQRQGLSESYGLPSDPTAFAPAQAPAEKPEPEKPQPDDKQPATEQKPAEQQKPTEEQKPKEEQKPAQDEKPQQPDDNALQEEIKRMVEQLTAERFSERQEASRRLAEIGKPAIPALTERALGDSLEGIIRSIDILRGLYRSEDEATRQAAKEALEKIAKSENPSAARRAADALKAGAKPPAPPTPKTQPKPAPVAQPANGKTAVQRVETARLALQHWAELLPRLTGSDDLKGASKQSLDELRKAAQALQRELAELEKRLEAAAPAAQPEAAEQKSPPAELPVEKPQQQ